MRGAELHRSAPASWMRRLRDAQHAGRDLRLGLADQVQVMGGDQDGLAHPVQLDQQRQQAQRHLPVDVAGGFVGQDHVRADDDGAGQGGALPFAARKLRRQRIGQVRQARPSPAGRSGPARSLSRPDTVSGSATLAASGRWSRNWQS